MFSLWYLVLGAKEYRRDWSLRSGKSPPSPAPATTVKPDVIPKASDPIPINKDTKNIAPAPPKPPRPDVPKPSPPKAAEAPKASPPKTPEVAPPKPSLPVVPTPDLPLSPEPPKVSPPKVPESPKISPPKVPEPPKVSPPKTPESPRTPEVLKPQTPPVRAPLSREDELMGRSAGLRQPEPNRPRGTPVDLSYQPSPPNAPPRYKEKVVVSNPDSLESSEAED